MKYCNVLTLYKKLWRQDTPEKLCNNLPGIVLRQNTYHVRGPLVIEVGLYGYDSHWRITHILKILKLLYSFLDLFWILV